MRALISGSVAGALLFAAPVNAQKSEWYGGLEAGAEFDGNFGDGIEANQGFAVLGTVGRRLGSNFAIEGELGYRSVDQGLFPWFTQIDINQFSMMANIVYEMPVTDALSLSVGVGAGYDNVSLQAPASDSDLKASAQLKLGAAYSVGETMDVTVNLRLMTATENKFTNIDNETLTVGLRFGF